MTLNYPGSALLSKDPPLKLADLTGEQLNQLYYSARVAYQNLIKIQFQLSYHAHISIGDLDNMPRYEYLMFYDNLAEQKNAESEAVEKASKK